MKILLKNVWPSLLLSAVLCGVLIYQSASHFKTNNVQNYNDHLDLYKSSVSGPYCQYILDHVDDAIALSKEYNVPVYMILGTAIVESSAGSSVLATKHNNHFGMNGKGVKMKDEGHIKSFKKYESGFESYLDYCRLWDKPRYADLRVLNGNWEFQAREMKRRGYAQNPQYAALLISVIERYSLWKLDRIKDGLSPDFVTL